MALSMAEAGAEHDSRVSWIAPFFHSFPHIDYTFSAVNSTFDPRSNIYLESLGIIASVPGFWLILNLLAFLIYFLSRCCERDWKAKNLLCYKVTLAILALLCCGALGLGFYGNHETHIGIEIFESTMRSINGVIVAVRNETMFIKNTLEVNTEPELDTLDQIFRRSIGNSSVQESLKHAVDVMRMDVHNGTQNIVRINRRLQQLNLDPVVNLTHQVEVIRWPSTMALLSVFALFCIILIIGICRNSRSTLIAFTVLGLLAVILNWLLVSVYVSSCVALGDLCVDPDSLIYSQAGNVLDKSIVNYYMDCPDGRENPFTKAIGQGQQNVDNVERELQFIATNAKSFYPEILLNQVVNSLRSHLEVTERVLANLSALLDCKDMHKQYERAVVSICTPTLNGVAFMLIAAAGAGLAFILLIWISAHTWMYIRKRVVCAESDYVQVDEQDPFLPSSAVMAQSSASSRRAREPQIVGRPRHTPPHTPPFPGAYNGRIPRGSDDHMTMHGRFTPPPSYEQLSAFLPSAPYKSE